MEKYVSVCPMCRRVYIGDKTRVCDAPTCGAVGTVFTGCTASVWEAFSDEERAAACAAADQVSAEQAEPEATRRPGLWAAIGRWLGRDREK